MTHLLKVFGHACVVGQLVGAAVLAAPDPTTAAAPSTPTPPGTNTPQPHIVFSETAFDFGKVKSTDILKHDFIVTNTGNAVLEISAVQPGCGCTMAGEWDRQVQPGKTGKIPLQLNATTFNGPVSKAVTVTCNDPAQGMHALQIHATVVRPFDVQPQYVTLVSVEGESAPEPRIVRIINNQEEAVTLETPHSTTPAFKAELRTVRPGKEFELHISYAGSVGNAASQGQIVINTSASNVPPISVTAVAMLQPALSAIPAVIHLPSGPLQAEYRVPETIRINSSTLVQLSEPSVNAEGVTVQMQERTPGKLFTLNVVFPTNFQASPDKPVELAVKTSHPKYPVLKVPVVQRSVAAPARVPPLQRPGVNLIR